MAKIAVIGAGSWGTALTHCLSGNGHDVAVWSVDPDEVDMINRFHEQKVKLPGVILGEGVRATTKLEEAVSDRDALVLAVPSPFTRSTARRMAPLCRYGQLIISVAKGLEEDSLMTLSSIIQEEIPHCETAVLCGPTHAEEVAKDLPTTIVAASHDEDAALRGQHIFMNDVMRGYTNDDITGVELCGAMKNIIALASGAALGLGYGDNTKAALITRGMHEISCLGVAMGCDSRTFSGLAGIGDLIVTATSEHSRNNRCGHLIGQGFSPKDAIRKVGMVVEGINAIPAALELKDKYGIDMPLVDAIDSVVNHGADPKQTVHHLMTRAPRSELEYRRS